MKVIQIARARFLTGLKKALAKFLRKHEPAALDRVAAQEAAGKALFSLDHGGDPHVWFRTPLDDRLAEYAACDVEFLLPMLARWGRSWRKTCGEKAAPTPITHYRKARFKEGETV